MSGCRPLVRLPHTHLLLHLLLNILHIVHLHKRPVGVPATAMAPATLQATSPPTANIAPSLICNSWGHTLPLPAAQVTDLTAGAHTCCPAVVAAELSVGICTVGWHRACDGSTWLTACWNALAVHAVHAGATARPSTRALALVTADTFGADLILIADATTANVVPQR